MPGYQAKTGGKVTRVTDTFNRGTLNPVGNNLWTPIIETIVPFAAAPTWGVPQCNNTSQILLSGQANGGGASSAVPTLVPCTGLTFAALNGQTQYCQATFQSLSNANAIAAGLMVMGAWNGVQGATWYGFNFSQSGTPFLEFAQVSGAVLSTVTIFTAAPGQTVGDVWRLSFNVSTNVLTLTKNGTVVFSGVPANLLSTGIPGFQIRTNNAGAGVMNSVNLSNLDCGLGL